MHWRMEGWNQKQLGNRLLVAWFFWLHMIIYDYFSSVFVLCQSKYCCWNYWKWVSHLKNHYHYAKVVENARINFAMLFSRREIFWSSFVSCSLPWRSWLHCECVRISALKYCQYQTGHLLAFRKWPQKYSNKV